MTTEQFDKVVNDACSSIVNVLSIKAKEYVRGENRMHNFDLGVEMTGNSREEVIYGFSLKHLISLRDMRNDVKEGKLPSLELVHEKFGDAINYLILEKASIIDKINNQEF